METSAAPTSATTETPAVPTVEVKTADVKPVETPTAKDPKAIHVEQEKRLEARATALRTDLAKRERELTEKTAQLTKREAAVKELASLKEAKASAKDDPISFLESFGLTFEDVAKAAASGTGADPAARKALKEARELRAKLDERDKTEAETQKKSAADKEAAQKQTTLATIDSMLKADKKYRYAAEFGSADDVFDAWFQAYQRTGKMPDVHKVAEKVNEYYKGQAERAHKAWAEELSAKPPEKPAAPPTAQAPAPAAAKADKSETAVKGDDGELRGRTRGQGSRSYQGEIMKQLEEARKSRAS